MLVGLQIRAARALLDMTQKELSKISGVKTQTLRSWEETNGLVRGRLDLVTKVKDVLEKRGIEFIDGDGDDYKIGMGVRLNPNNKN